ncbi:MAG: alpha/beta hydrolase [Acidobacteria bacterium]|nr:alpha/beta hydrolase [Acidobacteriota bacterium]
MTPSPIPIAIGLRNGVTLRGHEWSVDGPPVVFVHDLGHDLDAWGQTTSTVARSGFRVISLELRGHGLSDGDPDPSAALEDLRLMLSEVVPSFGPVGLVSYGSSSEALLSLDGEDGAPVQVIISPKQLDPDGFDRAGAKRAVRLVIGGSLDEEAQAFLGKTYLNMLGEKLWVSVATAKHGPALLIDQPSSLEHLTIFLRRYLTGYHLSWIKEHDGLIRAAAESRGPDNEPASQKEE